MPVNQLDKLFRPALVRYAIGNSADSLAKDLRLFSLRNTMLPLCFGIHSGYFLLGKAGVSLHAIIAVTWLLVVGVICILFPFSLWTDIKTYMGKNDARFSGSRSPIYCTEAVEVLMAIFELCIREGKPAPIIELPCKLLGLSTEQTKKVWDVFLRMPPVKFYVRVDLERLARAYLLTGQFPKADFNAYAQTVLAEARSMHSSSCSSPAIAKRLRGKSPATKFLKNCDDTDFEKRVWFKSWLICQQAELRGSAAEVCAARLNSILYRDDGRSLDERLVDISANLDQLGTHYSKHNKTLHERVTRHLSEIALKDIANQNYNRLDCKLDGLPSEPSD